MRRVACPTYCRWLCSILAGERAALEGRSEYLDGEVFAMAGAGLEHNIIIVNIGRELSTQLKGRPCQVYANGMKVLIRSPNAGKYLDLVGHCGEPEPLDGHRGVLLNPGLVVEVLSASTETYDRESKIAHQVVGQVHQADLHLSPR